MFVIVYICIGRSFFPSRVLKSVLETRASFFLKKEENLLKEREEFIQRKECIVRRAKKVRTFKFNKNAKECQI